MTLVQARKKFSDWVDEMGGASEAAERLDCTVQTVAHIRTGRRNAGLRIALALEEFAGIPATAWLR